MIKDSVERPSLEQIDHELARRHKQQKYFKTLFGTIWILIVVSAFSIIMANFFLAVLKIQGSSMNPTLEKGEIVVATRMHQFETGDILAFYFNNKVLLKRVIGMSGDLIDIDEDGNVFVNNELLEETYLKEKTIGVHDIEFPYQVPENRYFVLGDHRDVSLDSRSDVIGTIAEEQVIGEVKFRVWPLNKFGKIQ